MSRERPRLYLITPPEIDLAAFSHVLDEALQGGDVACLQLRLKNVPRNAIIAAARKLMPICHQYDVALLINDDASIAAEVGADGVHIGQEDTPYDEARHLLGDDTIIGVTCHNSRHLALEAGEAGADYVAFGAFFPTTTKQPKFSAELELLTWWQEMMQLPCVAIGGINVDNCRDILAAGADFIAVASGVWDYPKGPRQAVADFNEAIDAVMAGE